MKKTLSVNLAHGRDPHYKKLLEKIRSAQVCPFCPEHLKKYHQKPITKITKSWILTANMRPYDGAKVHLLFILKRHAENMIDLKNQEMENLLQLVKWSIKKYKIPGGSFILRFGDTDYTGGSVAHLHAQLVSGGKRRKNKAAINPVLGYKK